MQVRERSGQGGLDFVRRPERDHATTAVSFAEDTQRLRQREIGLLVIFIARSLPGTTTTGIPSRSQSAASSVAARSGSQRFAVGALDHLSRESLWRLDAHQSPTRSMVSR